MNRFKNKSILFFTIFALSFTACNLDKPSACMSLSTDYFLKDSIISFNNCSVGVDTYLWDFGDSTTSTERSPKHIYSESAQYDIKLLVDGKYGSDSIFHTITVWKLEED